MKHFILTLAALALMVQAIAETKNSNINVGPWITNVSDHSLTVLWTTTAKDMGWVELENGTKVYETFAGRRIFGNFHCVKIKNIENPALKYRVGGCLLVDETNPYDPSFGDTWNGEWYSVKLFNDTDTDVTFSVTNDIHKDTVAYRNLISCVDMDKADFIFLNGDIASAGNYDIKTLVEYEIAPLGEYAHRIPIFFARGNHEGRGNGVKNVAAVYPNSVSESFYYGFREGPAACIVMDGGETHEDRSLRYAGAMVFEDYLAEQIEWVKKISAEKWFADAPLKICFIHAPMIDPADKDDFYLHRWMNRQIVPLLNEIGIDVMIGADLHVQMECLPGTMHNNFPIIVNSAANRLDFDARDGKMTLKCFTPKGKQVYSGEFAY